MIKTIFIAAVAALAICLSAAAQTVGISGCFAATISATGTSSNVQLSKCAPTVLLLNVGSNEAFYVLGATNATTATSSNFSIPANSYQLVNVGTSGPWLAAISSSGTTLRVTQGVVQ